MSFSRQLVSVLAAVVLSTAQAGTVIFVDDDNCPGPGNGTARDPYCSIQTAIDNAVDGDEIVVADGLYTGPGNRDLDFSGRLITLRSENGPDNCIIDCEDAGRGFLFINGETLAAVVDGFTIHDGNGFVDGPLGEKGGGMYIDHSSPTVTDCIFSSNVAAEGGAIYAIGGSPMLAGCTFSANSACGDFAFGGAIYTAEGSTTVAGCTFLDNLAFGRCIAFGGAIYRSGSNIVMDCVFSQNDAIGGSCAGTSFGAGGAVYNAGGVAVVANCAFTENSVHGANAAGGAMRNAGGNQTVTNCTFIGNSASDFRNFGSGGGISGGSPTVTNCTFSGNSADFGSGGGISGGSPTVTNCILWGDNPDEISGGGTVTYSNVQGGFPGTGNIDADPLFVDPDNGDFRLSPGSPCIDAGDNTALPEDITTDLDGTPRFVDDPNTPDTGNGVPPIVDMGAYEFPPACLAITAQEVVCHPDGSAFTVNVEGVNACTGSATMVTFTGSGGAVGEDVCFTLLITDDQGTFCCLTQVCIPVPDCDCNGNGIADEQDIADGTSDDCNANLIPDECDIADGTSTDINGNGVPDDCEADCNGNGVPDVSDIADGTSSDCNLNGIPDECDLPDCNGNSVPDECDIADGTSTDFNGNGIPDECEAVPPNGNCDNAGVIRDGAFPFNTLGATTDGFQTLCEGSTETSFVDDIWFLYTAPCSGIATFSTCNDADFDTRVAVYFATGCPPGAPLACSDNAPGCGQTSHVQVNVFEGIPYLVRVGGTSGGGSGTLTVSCGSPGDLDGDGVVGAADLLMLLGQWGPCPASCYADMDGDSLVGVTDLLILLANWSP